MPRPNHFLDNWRNQITNRSAARNPVSNFGGGNIDSPLHPEIFVCDWLFRPSQNDKGHHLLQTIEVAPGRELRQIVVADEEEELSLAMLGRELFDRPNSVGGRAMAQLEIVGFEARVAGDSCQQHFPTHVV